MTRPLPVVGCWVLNDPEPGRRRAVEYGPGYGVVGHEYRFADDGDHPGVAIPWALLEDETFRCDVTERALDLMLDLMHKQGTVFAPFVVIDALAAELRARAGGAA